MVKATTGGDADAALDAYDRAVDASRRARAADARSGGATTARTSSDDEDEDALGGGRGRRRARADGPWGERAAARSCRL